MIDIVVVADNIFNEGGDQLEQQSWKIGLIWLQQKMGTPPSLILKIVKSEDWLYLQVVPKILWHLFSASPRLYGTSKIVLLHFDDIIMTEGLEALAL